MTGRSAEDCREKVERAGWVLWQPRAGFATLSDYEEQTREADEQYRAQLRLPPDLGPQLDRYQAHYRALVAAGDRSDNTLAAICWAMETLFAVPHWQRGTPVAGIVRADLTQLVAWLTTERRPRLAPRSVAHLIKILKMALRWAKAEGYPAPQADPFFGLKLPSPPPPKALPRPEVLRAFVAS